MPKEGGEVCKMIRAQATEFEMENFCSHSAVSIKLGMTGSPRS
jgi:hypothetical protein